MKDLLNKISKQLGFTSTETKTLLFVLIIFIIGALGKYFKLTNKVTVIKKFNYSRQDSLFLELNNKKLIENTAKKIVQKRVDSKPELLDFRNKKKAVKKKTKLIPKEHSIDINSANLKTLTTLPGIGVVTAKKILALRNKKEKFNSLNELLEVKGIGFAKLKKLKKYLYVEK